MHICKREERHKGKSEYRFHGDLSIDYGAKRVQIGENDLELTKLEYAIIEFFVHESRTGF